ncbi:MAG: hypothetical protein FWC62_03300, partial [Firmicutes bacterium]|nr:hypothetical protein [Bacillota bacterium]
MPTTRKSSFIVFTAAYVLALVAGVIIFALLRSPGPLWRLAAADAVATLVIWLISLLVRNASVYDPYWSVAPPILLAGLMLYAGKASI